jgi:hypothetical protein
MSMIRRRPTRALLLFIVLPLLLASCSTSKADDVDKLALTRERIIQTFKKETGRGFVRRSVSEDIREWADLPRFEQLEPEPSRLLAERYGFFTIVVYDDRQARDSHLSGEGPLDTEGRYWYQVTVERGPHAGRTSWGAEKRYSDNVLLIWGVASGRRETSASKEWDRLDALMRRATE